MIKTINLQKELVNNNILEIYHFFQYVGEKEYEIFRILDNTLLKLGYIPRYINDIQNERYKSQVIDTELISNEFIKQLKIEAINNFLNGSSSNIDQHLAFNIIKNTIGYSAHNITLCSFLRILIQNYLFRTFNIVTKNIKCECDLSTYYCNNGSPNKEFIKKLLENNNIYKFQDHDKVYITVPQQGEEENDNKQYFYPETSSQFWDNMFLEYNLWKYKICILKENGQKTYLNFADMLQKIKLIKKLEKKYIYNKEIENIFFSLIFIEESK